MNLRTCCLIVCSVVSLAAVSYGQRITVAGNKLLVDGKPVWLNAANTPWNSWNDFGGNYNSSWWDAEFAELKSYGANAMRTWITCNGDAPLRIGTDGVVSGLSEKFWSDLDNYFSLARKHRIYVMATLISFDHTKDGNTNSDRFRRMYYSDAAIDSFVKNYVTPFVKRHKDNPYMCMIEPCNEIEWVHEEASKGAIPWDRLQKFVGKVAAAVHNNSQVLVTLGLSVKWQSTAAEGNFFSDAILKQQVPGPGVYLDVYSPHWYDWVVTWFGSPFADKTPASYNLADKPAVIGECPANGSWVVYENAWKNGWAGVFAWTSNGVDSNGSLASGLGTKIKTFYDAHKEQVSLTIATAPGVIRGRARSVAGSPKPASAAGLRDLSGRSSGRARSSCSPWRAR